jgi:hypothetical protein
MENKFNIICRCCLSEEGDMKNMLEDVLVLNKKRKIQILETYSACSGVDFQLVRNETWKNICERCEQTLALAYEFRELCQESNRVLLERSDLIPLEMKEEALSENGDAENSPNFVYAPSNNKLEGSSHQFNQVFVVKNSYDVDGNEIKTETDIPPSVENEIKPLENDAKSDFDQKDEPATNKATLKLDDENYEVISDMPGKFMCFVCDAVMSSHREYQIHRNSIHSESHRIDRNCLLCGETV